jgi:hypothetical protein
MKFEELLKLSNPEEVFKKFIRIYPPESHIKISSKKDKKYMIYNPHTQKYFHFGSTMPDFTRHMDMDRRNKFLLRNHGWKHYDKYTPAYASYYLTW